MGHVLRRDFDRRVAGVGFAVVENDVLRTLFEIDGLNVVVFGVGGVDPVAPAFVAAAGEGIGLAGGEILAVGVRAAQHGAGHLGILPGEGVKRGGLIAADRGGEIDLNILAAFQEDVDLIGIRQVRLCGSVPIHGDSPTGPAARNGTHMVAGAVCNKQSVCGNDVVRKDPIDVHIEG